MKIMAPQGVMHLIFLPRSLQDFYFLPPRIYRKFIPVIQ